MMMFSSFRRFFNGWSGKHAPPLVADDQQSAINKNDNHKNEPVKRLDPATGLMVERFYHKGKLHRDDDQPAVIEYEPDSRKIVREQYFHNGALHREGDKPAYIEYSTATGHRTLEVFFLHGKLYQTDLGTSAINYDRDTGERVIFDVNRPGSPPIK